MRHKLLSLAFCLGAGALLSSCTPFFKKPVVVLRVGDQAVTVSKFSKELNLHLKTFKNSPEKIQDASLVKKNVVDDLILKILIRNWAEKNNIKVSKKVSLKNFKEFLLFRGSNLGRIKKKSIDQSLQETLVLFLGKKQKISQKEKFAFYKKNKKMFFKPSSCKLKQILTQERSFAKILREKILKTSRFSKFAKLYSKSPEKKLNGNLGWVRKGTLDVFDEACSLSVGSVSPVLKSPYGFHIIKVEGKRKGFYEPFHKVSKKIQGLLEERQAKKHFEAWLKGQLDATPVFINQNVLAQINIRYRKKKL